MKSVDKTNPLPRFPMRVAAEHVSPVSMKHVLLFALLIPYAVSGCSLVRPADTTITIRGSAPREGACEIQLLQANKTDFHSLRRAVNGPFEATFILSFRNQEYFLEGGCDGEVTFMQGVVLPESSPLNIGTIVP